MYFASDLKHKLYLKLNKDGDKIVKVGKRPFPNSLPPNPKQECIYFAGEENVILTQEEYNYYSELITTYKLAKVKKDYPNSKGNLELQKLIYLVTNFSNTEGLKERLDNSIVYLPDKLTEDTKANKKVMELLGLPPKAVAIIVEKYFTPKTQENQDKLLEVVKRDELTIKKEAEENRKETLKDISSNEGREILNNDLNLDDNYPERETVIQSLDQDFDCDGENTVQEELSKMRQANNVLIQCTVEDRYIIDHDLSALDFRLEGMKEIENRVKLQSAGIDYEPDNGPRSLNNNGSLNRQHTVYIEDLNLRKVDTSNITDKERLATIDSEVLLSEGGLDYDGYPQSGRFIDRIGETPRDALNNLKEHIDTNEVITGNITNEDIEKMNSFHRDHPITAHHGTPEGITELLDREMKFMQTDNIKLSKDYSMFRIIDCENKVHYDIDCNVIPDSYSLGFFKEVDVPVVVINIEESVYYPCYYDVSEIDKVIEDILNNKLETDYIALDIE